PSAASVCSRRTTVGRGRPVSSTSTESVELRRRLSASRSAKLRRTSSITAGLAMADTVVRNTDFVDFAPPPPPQPPIVVPPEDIPMAYQTIDVRKLTPTIGAEMFGVDLAQPLGNQQFQEVHDALMDNLVIFFRDQKISIEQHKAFGHRFGPLHTHPNAPIAFP